jgi:methyl-accepting chemotaxis protein
LFFAFGVQFAILVFLCATAYFLFAMLHISLFYIAAPLIILLILSSAFIADAVSKTIVVPLKTLSDASIMMAEGIIDGSLSTNRRDEIGQLARDFDKVLYLLQDLNDDISNFCKSHHIQGDVYAKIDTSRYDGEYRETLSLLNNTVWQYIADGRDILFLASEYAKGNFNSQIRTFPGIRSVGNTICSGLRKSLVDTTSEIIRVSNAASDGNFTLRIDEGHFKGELNNVVKSINRLIDSIMEPISETTSVMLSLYDGNFDTVIKGDFNGDFALVKTSVNNMVQSLKLTLENAYESTASLNEAVAAVSTVLSENSSPLQSIVEKMPERLAEDDTVLKLKNDTMLHADALIKTAESLKQSSADTYKAMEIIEDIAFQTNHLSLIAGMEAAKTPQENKGLKSLADDAASLSQRSRDAINDVKQIFDNAVSQADYVTESINVMNEFVSALTSMPADEAPKGNNEELISLTRNISDAIEKTNNMKNTAELLRNSLAQFLNKIN